MSLSSPSLDQGSEALARGRWGAVGSWALSPDPDLSGMEPGSAKPEERQARGLEGLQAEQSPKESSRPLPVLPRLLFRAFSVPSSRAISLSLSPF